MPNIIYTKAKLLSELESRHINNKVKLLKDLPSPYNFKDLEKASKRIVDAIKQNEKICIVGDYDVDGIISTAIMKDFFSKLGVNVDVIIPNRFKDGYGLSPSVIKTLKDKFDSSLIITVDNGISSIEASKLAFDLNIELIITDHHTVPKELPKAYAIINPKQVDCNFEFKDICGAQVAWYLCAGIKKELKSDIDLSIFLDLLSIAIIADIMPMVGLNHTMVKSGFKALLSSKRASIRALLDSLSNPQELCSSDIGFMIAPKLNSAGRLSDAIISLDFLLANNYTMAIESLLKLEQLNNQRKELQNSIFIESIDKVNIEDEIIIVASKDWHEGVIGIVASKLVDKFNKPAFVFSIKDNIAKGSARSLNEINLYQLLEEVQKKSNILIGYGGHKLAAGLKIGADDIDDFRIIINKIYNNKQQNISINNSDDNIKDILLKEIDFELFDIIQAFEPYGLDNPKPIFRLSNILVKHIRYVGKEKSHLIFYVYEDGHSLKAIDFNSTIKLDENDHVDIVFEINKNSFRQENNLELFIKSIKKV